MKPRFRQQVKRRQSFHGEFQPAEYQDTHREELLEMIHAKVEGDEYQPLEARLLPTNVTDIVARLKASIDQAQGQKKVKKKGKG